MDQSYTESDVSLSPSQILERLQVLRQLQLLQRGKLQKQRLEYQEPSENSSSATEIVSHFSNSTSYNTFRSLLESAYDSSTDGTPRLDSKSLSQKVKQRDLVEGVSILNLSQESEFIVNSPVSSRSVKSAPSRNEEHISSIPGGDAKPTITQKNLIALEDMPILSPKKDFETLVLEKLRNEKSKAKTSPLQKKTAEKHVKRPFLRKGEGMSRFGLQKKDLVIQSMKALPWRRQSLENKIIQSPLRNEINRMSKTKGKKVNVEIIVTKPQLEPKKLEEQKVVENDKKDVSNTSKDSPSSLNSSEKVTSALMQLIQKPLTLPTGKHPLKSGKGSTWASVLSKEQNDFLRQLKQSDYYKNFTSPSKSTISDGSCDETMSKLRYEREIAEQNMFELLENKVSHESFNMENSFFNKFLKRSKLECSGESTPLVMQHCLANNPDLIHIYPNLNRKRNHNSHSDIETCNSECTDCCSDTCSSVSTCCSFKTVEETNITPCKENSKKVAQKSLKPKNIDRKEAPIESNKEDKSDTVNDNDNLQSNMVEMNAKLIATSELLKDRLRELEDEIETFRQENANLTKMREEIDAERQKFYEEKSMFEQKFNEEKILSEYYLAEEKEKLTKQKQIYDKYVREMRGRLNKKDKDEVLNLRKEISDLKEEIRLKDAKSTSSIARLRNQIKLMEKEKKANEEEIEKLKKENRRIQHSNDMTRRMTNIKYLEQINKKLANITAKETQSEVILDSNAKYKAFEIERQSRNKKVQPDNTGRLLRTRAKSVPNLNVTSRYAKYFSQRDVLSDFERTKTVDIDPLEKYDYTSDNDYDDDVEIELLAAQGNSVPDSDQEDDNSLEKLYIERFHSVSPKSLRSNTSNPSTSYNSISNNPDTFFITKGNSNRDSKSPSNTISPFNNSNGSNSNRSKSPISILSHRSSDQRSPRNYINEISSNRDTVKNSATFSRGSSKPHSKSPMSILTNRSSVQKPATVIHNDNYKDRLTRVSPDPSTSKSSLTKTNLNPTEIKKPDGSRELRFPNGNVKFISSDGKYSKFVYYNGDVKENFLSEGRIKYFYAETKTYHTTHADGLEVLEFPDGQVEKRYKDGSTEIRLPNGSVRYFDPKNEHVREEWRFPDGAALTISANGEQRIVFSNGQVEVHAKDHKRREFPDGTVKLVYNDGTSETRYSSGRVRIKDKHGNLIMDSASG